MNENQTPVIQSMDAMTIRIFLRSDGDYDIQVWPCDLDQAQQLENEGDDTGADNGGVCTGNMYQALEMAQDFALRVGRIHFSDNVFNVDVCPSSLDELGEPSTRGETAHKWSPQLSSDDYNNPVIACDECGAVKDEPVNE